MCFENVARERHTQREDRGHLQSAISILAAPASTKQAHGP